MTTHHHHPHLDPNYKRKRGGVKLSRDTLVVMHPFPSGYRECPCRGRFCQILLFSSEGANRMHWGRIATQDYRVYIKSQSSPLCLVYPVLPPFGTNRALRDRDGRTIEAAARSRFSFRVSKPTRGKTASISSFGKNIRIAYQINTGRKGREREKIHI